MICKQHTQRPETRNERNFTGRCRRRQAKPSEQGWVNANQPMKGPWQWRRFFAHRHNNEYENGQLGRVLLVLLRIDKTEHVPRNGSAGGLTGWLVACLIRGRLA